MTASKMGRARDHNPEHMRLSRPRSLLPVFAGIVLLVGVAVGIYFISTSGSDSGAAGQGPPPSSSLPPATLPPSTSPPPDTTPPAPAPVPDNGSGDGNGNGNSDSGGPSREEVEKETVRKTAIYTAITVVVTIGVLFGSAWALDRFQGIGKAGKEALEATRWPINQIIGQEKTKQTTEDYEETE